MTKRAPLICAAAVALLAPAASAGAATTTTTDYRVETEVAVHYEHHAAPPNYDGEIHADLSLATRVAKVSFRDGELVAVAGGETTVSNADSGAYIEYHGPGGSSSGSCSGSTALPGRAAEIREAEVGPLTGGSRVIISPFASLHLPWTCTGMGTALGALMLPNFPGDAPAGPFDLDFELPAEATGTGKIIQLVNRDVPAAECPLRNPDTISCSMHVEGVVTFWRTGQRTEQVDDNVPEPLVDPPAPAEDDDLLTPLVSAKRGKLAPGGRSAAFTLHCDAACALTARVYAGGRRPIATRRVTLAEAGSRRVTVPFGRSARRAIKRTGRVRIELSGGGPALRLRLRA